MSHELAIDGILYISSKRASELTGYSQDYIGQLARAGKIIGRRVGGLWYVLENSIFGHKEVAEAYVPTPPAPETVKPLVSAEDAAIVTFDGKTYVAAARAAKLTSYHQDYIGQLARSGKILSRQIGNRWYVDIEALKSHKKEKDTLLGAVQSAAVGLQEQKESAPIVVESAAPKETTSNHVLHYSYTGEAHPLLPILSKIEKSLVPTDLDTNDVEHVIPIRIVRTHAASKALEHVSRPVSDEINHVRIPRKSIFYKGFTAVVVIIVLIVAYNIQPIKGTNIFAKLFEQGMVSSAVKGFDTTSQSSGFKDLFSKKITYQRGQ